MSTYTVPSYQVDASQLLTPPAGYTLISGPNVLADLSLVDPSHTITIEEIQFQTQTGPADVLAYFQNGANGQQAAIAQMQSQIAAQGSVLFQWALYQKTVVNVTVPDSFSIPATIFGSVPVPFVGGETFNIPGGGTVLAEVNDYQLVAIHSQPVLGLGFFIGITILILAAAFVFWLVAHNQSVPAAINDLITGLRQWSVQLAQAPFQGTTNTLIWFVVGGAALAFAVASLSKSTDLNVGQPQVPSLGPPSVAVSGGVGPVRGTIASPGSGGGGGGRAPARRRS